MGEVVESLGRHVQLLGDEGGCHALVLCHVYDGRLQAFVEPLLGAHAVEGYELVGEGHHRESREGDEARHIATRFEVVVFDERLKVRPAREDGAKADCRG